MIPYLSYKDYYVIFGDSGWGVLEYEYWYLNLGTGTCSCTGLLEACQLNSVQLYGYSEYSCTYVRTSENQGVKFRNRAYCTKLEYSNPNYPLRAGPWSGGAW